MKEPRPGRVKTRLARTRDGDGAGLGAVGAARWFRGQALRLIRTLKRDPRWELRLAVAPEREGLASRVWPPGVTRQSQGGGDLGARMARALRGAAPGPALVIGADIPEVTPARIAEAFRALGPAEAVFGPAEDGGFWLVGLAPAGRPPPPRLFRDARWSTRHALADARATLGDARVALAATLADVDRPSDLRRGARTAV